MERHEVRLARLTGQGPDFGKMPAPERRAALHLALPPVDVRDAWRALKWIEPPPSVADRLFTAVGERDYDA
jgi:hypothetical protein